MKRNGHIKTQGSLLNRLKSYYYRQTTTLGATFTILDCEYMKIILHELWLILKDVNMKAILAVINTTRTVVKNMA